MSKMTIQEMIKMPLDSACGESDCFIKRVPGGWIYYQWDFDLDSPKDSGTFVPEPKEAGSVKEKPEIKELDWSAEEHDPELIEDLWPVETWIDAYPYVREYRFFDKESNKTIMGDNGERDGIQFNHYRAIPREKWSKWQEEKYNELRERYYGEE